MPTLLRVCEALGLSLAQLLSQSGMTRLNTVWDSSAVPESTATPEHSVVRAPVAAAELHATPHQLAGEQEQDSALRSARSHANPVRQGRQRQLPITALVSVQIELERVAARQQVARSAQATRDENLDLQRGAESLRAVARRIGVPARTFYRRFPALCRQIAQEHRAARQQLGEQRIVQRAKEIALTARKIARTGRRPTMRAIRGAYPQPGYLRDPSIRSLVQAAQRHLDELGQVTQDNASPWEEGD
jgi:hypothetical protein